MPRPPRPKLSAATCTAGDFGPALSPKDVTAGDMGDIGEGGDIVGKADVEGKVKDGTTGTGAMGAMGGMGAMVSGVCFTGATVATGADATGVSITASVTKWDRACPCPGPGAAGAVANAQGSEVNGRPFGPVGPLGPGTGSEGNDDIGAMDGTDKDEMLNGVIGVDWTGTALPPWQRVLASYILSPISSPANILKQVKRRWEVTGLVDFIQQRAIHQPTLWTLKDTPPKPIPGNWWLIHAYNDDNNNNNTTYCIHTFHLSLLLRHYAMQPQEKQICGSTKDQNVPHPNTEIPQLSSKHRLATRLEPATQKAHGYRSQTCTSHTFPHLPHIYFIRTRWNSRVHCFASDLHASALLIAPPEWSWSFA